MPETQLRQTLERLHSELEQHPRLDADAQHLLRELLEDITDLLGPEESAHDAESLIERLRAATRRFETSHPTLTEIVGHTADLLSRLGI